MGHEILNLINKLNCDNVEKLKLELMKLMYLHLLSLGESSKKLRLSQLEQIYETANYNILDEVKEQFTKEIKQDLSRIRYSIRFNEAIDSFTESLIEHHYTNDAIELLEQLIMTLGAKPRVFKLWLGKKDMKLIKYRQSSEYLAALKNELFDHIKLQSKGKLLTEIFLINAMIHWFKNELEDNENRCNGYALSHFKGSKQPIEECENNVLIGKYFSWDYKRELERRVYLWNKLVFDFSFDYSVREMLGEEEE